MRNLQKTVWVTIFVIFAGLFGLAVWSAEQTKPPTHAKSTHQSPAENHEKKNGESFWERTTGDPVATFTAILALFTAVLTGISIIQIRFLIHADQTARESADAAKASVGVARGTLIADQRAWMKVSVVADGDLTSDDAGIHLPVCITMKNLGRTPAIRVWYINDFFVQTRSRYDPIAEQKIISDNVKKSAKLPIGQIIFPGDTVDWKEMWHISRKLVEEGFSWMRPDFPHQIGIIIIGVVIYEFSFEREQHQTGFIYDVAVRDQADTEQLGFVDASVDSVPKERIVLLTTGLSSAYID